MKWLGTVVLLVLAALLFSYNEPIYAPEILKALVVAIVTAGLAFAMVGSGRPVLKAIDSTRAAAAVVVLLAGVIVTFSLFTSPLLGISFAVILLGGSGFAIYQVLNSPAAVFRAPNASPLQIMIDNRQRDFEKEALDKKLEVAARVSQLTSLEASTSTIKPQTNATIKAYEGAAELKLTPGGNYDAYKLKELEILAPEIAKNADVDREHRKNQNEYGIDLQSAKDLGNRVHLEAIELQNMRAKAQEEFQEIVGRRGISDDLRVILLRNKQETIDYLTEAFRAKTRPKSDVENLDRKDLRPNFETTE